MVRVSPTEAARRAKSWRSRCQRRFSGSLHRAKGGVLEWLAQGPTRSPVLALRRRWASQQAGAAKLPGGVEAFRTNGCRNRTPAQGVEHRCIEPMHGGPAVQSLVHVARDGLLSGKIDHARDKAAISVPMDRREKAHHRSAHAARRHRQGCLLRRDAGRRGRCRIRSIVFSP